MDPITRQTERIDKLAETLAGLIERIGHSIQSQSEFKAEVRAELKDIKEDQSEVKEFLNKVKGGWKGIAVLMTVASTLGAGAAWVLEKIIG